LWGNRFDFVSTALARQNQQAKIFLPSNSPPIFACWFWRARAVVLWAFL